MVPFIHIKDTSYNFYRIGRTVLIWICCHSIMRNPVLDYKNPLHLDVVDRYLRRMGDKTIPDESPPSLESFCLVHPCVRDKRRVSEIDLSQPRHETAFWWRHNMPVTSQLTDPIALPNYPLELIGIYVHINTQNKESLTQRCRRSKNVQLCLICLYISIWFES